MHAPLPRSSLPRPMRENASDATRALVWPCAFVVIVSVALVSIATMVGKLTVGATGMRGAALSSSRLVGVVKPPQVEASYTLFD